MGIVIFVRCWFGLVQNPAQNCPPTLPHGAAVALFHATVGAFRNVTGRPASAHPLVSRFCDETLTLLSVYMTESGMSGPAGVAMLWLGRGFGCNRNWLCSSPSARLPHDVCLLVSVAARIEGSERRLSYVFERKERVELDQAMKIAKEDRNWQEDDVSGVLAEEAHELDHLGEAEHEDDLGNQEGVAVGGRPLGRRPPARIEHERVEDKGQRGEGGNMQGIGAPGLLAVGTG